MKHFIQITSISTMLLLTGCVENLPQIPGMSSNLDQEQNKALIFKTNQVHFMHTLKENSSATERNVFIDEFILKSDMQCQNHLNDPLKKSEVDKSKDSLYMGIFDTMSGLFGFSLLTNTAKAVFLDDGDSSSEEKRAYANALSPEIRKGVELGRARYAQTMMQKKNLNLKAYSINSVKTDTLKYDKQCNDAYGLIEINRALKEMQNANYAQQTAPSLKINPQVIKAKVEAATKEVEKKKVEKEKTKVLPRKGNPVKVVPTQPKPVDVPVHRDSVQNLPRSPQL